MTIEKIKRQIAKLSPEDKQQLLSESLEEFKHEVFKSPG